MILRNNVVLPDRVEISPISLIPYMPNDYRYNFQVAAFNKANSEYTGTISNYITINKTGNFIPTIEASISNSGTVVLNYNVVPPGENPNNYTTTIFKNGKVLADWGGNNYDEEDLDPNYDTNIKLLVTGIYEDSNGKTGDSYLIYGYNQQEGNWIAGEYTTASTCN